MARFFQDLELEKYLLNLHSVCKVCLVVTNVIIFLPLYMVFKTMNLFKYVLRVATILNGTCYKQLRM